MSKVDVSELRGPLGELMDQFSGENGQARFEEFKLWLKKVSGLLKRVTTVATPDIKRFVAADVLGSTGVNKDGVKIAYLGDNFKRVFSNLVERDVPAGELAVDRLEHYATTLDIASTIPEAKRVVTMGQIYWLVRDQELNGSGPILINGWANLGLAYGNDGNVWLVDAYRYGVGWYFDANPLDSPDSWCDGNQVLSRK